MTSESFAPDTTVFGRLRPLLRRRITTVPKTDYIVLSQYRLT